MRKMILALVLALAGSLASGQDIGKKHHYTLAGDWDLDGAAASNTAIHSADAITDSATFTIDAQPDTPRPLTVVLTDGDSSISACTYTLVGTIADGTSVTVTATLTGGSGAKTLSTDYNLATVTSASVGVCTGEGGGDTVSLGTTSTIPTAYFLPYGSKTRNSQGKSVRNYNDWLQARKDTKLITNNDTAAASTTIMNAPTASNALSPVSVGDLLLVNLNGEPYERAITAKSDDTEVTVDEAILIDADGVPYRYRLHYLGPDSDDGAIPVGDFTAGTFTFIVTQLGNNLDSRVQCRNLGGGQDWVTIDDNAFTVAGTRVVAIDFRLAGYDQCRAGLQFDTSDADGDAGAEAEIITVQFVGVGRAGE